MALPRSVLDTLMQSRAPATRRLYALKWSVFAAWCKEKEFDPVNCSVSAILSFLQHRMDTGSMPSTLKVYVAAIAAFHAEIGGRSVGKHELITKFLQGARRLRHSRPPTVPSWDLALVLKALTLPPFEPILTVGLKELSLKTVLLLALASAKRIGDLHALSVNAECLQFGPGDCNVTLKPKAGYVPKSLSTPFRAQVISIPAFSSDDAATTNAIVQSELCPVRALKAYIDRSAPFWTAEQLFVCFGGSTKGHPVSKQRLSHWVVDAISQAYSSQGVRCPLDIRAHSTRAIASSWAWYKGASIQVLCLAAGWSSQNTFARFYNLDVSSLASRVLSVNTPSTSSA
nr:uncharacterized protein LOC129413761 [Misgurnus anguillicaudatus]